MSLRALGWSAATLYTNVYFRSGGQVNYVPQAHALKTRVMRSGAWMNSVGKSAYLVEADFQKPVAQSRRMTHCLRTPRRVATSICNGARHSK